MSFCQIDLICRISVATLALTLPKETSPPTPTMTVTNDGSVSRAVLVGGTVGGFLGGVALIAGIAALTWYIRVRRRRRISPPSPGQGKLVRSSSL